MNSKKELQIADYVVFGVALCLSMIAGIYYAYKDRNYKTAYRYHRGGGKLKAIPVALSMIVTFESSIFFLGYPAEVYIHGFIYWLTNVGMLIGFSCMLWITIPLFYTLQVTSVFEYFQMRYESIWVRRFASVFSTISMTLYSGIVLFGAAIAIESVTHISTWVSIVGMVAIAVTYTSLGGLKAVVVTDVVQGLVMIVSIFAVVIYGTITVGGVGNVIALNKPSGRLRLVDFDPNPLTRHTFWTLVVGGAIRSLGINFKQPTIQRLNSTISAAEARKVVYMSLTGFILLQLLVMAEGLVAYAYFSHKGCDPLASGEIPNPNQLISFIVLDMFHGAPGVPGLFIAALCSASLSTVSSLLSSTSAIISEDIVKPYWKGVSDEKLTNASKVIVILFGLLCIGVAVMIGQLKGPLSQITGSILGAIDGPMNGMFIMSIFVKFTTRKGMMTGVFFGIVFAMWISLGYNFSPGRQHTPWLPLGPTDKCENRNLTMDVMTFQYVPSNNTIETAGINNSFANSQTTTPIFIEHFGNSSVMTPDMQLLHGVDYLYSISYLYFPAMVLFVTLSIGLSVSKFTKPDRDPDVPIPQYLMLSFRKQFLCCFPKCGKSSAESEEYVEVTAICDTGNNATIHKT